METDVLLKTATSKHVKSALQLSTDRIYSIMESMRLNTKILTEGGGGWTLSDSKMLSM